MRSIFGLVRKTVIDFNRFVYLSISDQNLGYGQITILLTGS